HHIQNGPWRAIAGSTGGPQVRPPVAVDVHGLAGAGDHGGAGGEHPPRRGQGAWWRNVLEGQVPAQRAGVKLPQFTGVGERLALGGEPQQPVAPDLSTVAVGPVAVAVGPVAVTAGPAGVAASPTGPAQPSGSGAEVREGPRR